MAKKKLEDLVVSVRLSRELRERLRRTSGHRGLGEEIRRRVQASFDAETAPTDPTLGMLMGAIEELAGRLTIDGQWNDDEYLFQVFKAGVTTLVGYFEPQPGRDAAKNSKTYVVFNQKEPPEQVGQMMARFVISDLKKREFADRQKGKVP